MNLHPSSMTARLLAVGIDTVASTEFYTRTRHRVQRMYLEYNGVRIPRPHLPDDAPAVCLKAFGVVVL